MSAKRSNKKKQPKLANIPTFSKFPKVQLHDDFMSSQPAWHISLIEMKGPFSWHAVNKVTLNGILQKLSDFENMTWNEILVHGRKRNHPVEISDLCKDARDRLRVLNQDDIDELLSLGLNGKKGYGVYERATSSRFFGGTLITEFVPV